MVESSVSSDVKSLWKWIGGSAFLASMCCIPSVVLVLFGLASVSSAAALSNDLYWGTNGMSWFRPALSVLSLVLVALGLVLWIIRSTGRVPALQLVGLVLLVLHIGVADARPVVVQQHILLRSELLWLLL